MRQRVVKVLAALIVTAGGVVATAIAAGASGQDGGATVPVIQSVDTGLQGAVQNDTDSSGWG
jgi:hypothetical protein